MINHFPNGILTFLLQDNVKQQNSAQDSTPMSALTGVSLTDLPPFKLPPPSAKAKANKPVKEPKVMAPRARKGIAAAAVAGSSGKELLNHAANGSPGNRSPAANYNLANPQVSIHVLMGSIPITELLFRFLYSLCIYISSVFWSSSDP